MLQAWGEVKLSGACVGHDISFAQLQFIYQNVSYANQSAGYPRTRHGCGLRLFFLSRVGAMTRGLGRSEGGIVIASNFAGHVCVSELHANCET